MWDFVPIKKSLCEIWFQEVLLDGSNRISGEAGRKVRRNAVSDREPVKASDEAPSFSRNLADGR